MDGFNTARMEAGWKGEERANLGIMREPRCLRIGRGTPADRGASTWPSKRCG